MFISYQWPKPEIRIWKIRPVVPGGAGGAMASLNFGRSANPISTKGGRLCTPNINAPSPGFSDLPMALKIIYRTWLAYVSLKFKDNVSCECPSNGPTA